MRNRDSRARLRAILAGVECVRMGTVFDPVSARFAEALGYRAGLVGGSIISHAVLGAPDLIVLTLTELADQVRRCTRVSGVPLVIDGDHGYGNALNVIRTVQELDAAGAAAVMIEDTLLPRPFGSSEMPQLLSAPESLGKIRAAIAGRANSDMLVFGRTSAVSLTGIDDAIQRLRAYAAAGVDALMLPALRTREELEAISAAVALPLVIGGPGEALRDVELLARHRVRLFSTGHEPFSACINALYAAMHAVIEGGALPPSATKEVFGIAIREAQHRAWIGDFLTPRE
ncbi:MAG TPA: isocitrate lyase/PEP mutase family protein [Casimicrobiaceae bacterium]|nr:isocitrate lyase/PEP mutase family protein [Casimicrobiaceae bacterium]